MCRQCQLVHLGSFQWRDFLAETGLEQFLQEGASVFQG